jgi:hypothetical protein
VGLYYGGQAWEQAKTNAIANTIIAESQQILAAQRIWAVNHGQTDATGATMVTLVNDGELTYPTGSLSQLDVTTPNPVPDYDNLTLPCGSGFLRYLFTYNGGNYVDYSFGPGFCGPVFGIAVAINTTLGVTQTSMPTTLTWNYGIPQNANPSGGPGAWYSDSFDRGELFLDSSNNLITNMCVQSWDNGTINCTFGPS